ncbi:MAG: SRPBCC domain-containing protein [Cytophagaceae bacterium]|jgi:PhnB protein|nr:SRPBCC domain-containing protein [Cytophagaceae bacterium]
MKNSLLFNFDVNKAENSITVERSFRAPLDLVWSAWTQAEILDQWWAPKPYRTETKSMNFSVGGRWHYSMVSPQGERHWCLFEYESIEKEQSYSGLDAFCDEQANIQTGHPRMHWTNTFHNNEGGTMVRCLIRFNQLSDLETIMTMGFQEGFSMAIENLDAYIQAQFLLKQEKKSTSKERVCTYLNFPGNTEEALRFYQSVFKTEFVKGIQRFSDLPENPAMPPLHDSVKNMVLHAELPLIGGHILMATDAPAEMGFTVISGNNMHIHLEPANRSEADRIFHELSSGGNIEMPMQEMFWGAYFGSFKDKYGINWMIQVLS